MTRRHVFAGLVAVAAVYAGGDELDHAQAYPVIPAVLAESERSGWPHASTRLERVQAARAVLRAEAPRGRARILCRWPSRRMGPFYCGIVAPAQGGTARYRVNVRVWEDGSFRILPGRPVSRRGN